MAHGDIIHTVHDLAEYGESTDDSSHTLEDKYYYKTNKRKRKTNVPRKRDHPNDDSGTDELDSIHGENYEPMNLINKSSSKVDSLDELEKNPAPYTTTNLFDQQRIYNLLLEYLMLKYQIPPEPRSQLPNAGNPIFAFEKMTTRLTETSPKQTGLIHKQNTVAEFLQSGSEQRSDAVSSESQIEQEHAQSILFDSNCYTSSAVQNSSQDFKHTISQALNTCIHNIPIPKTGYTNYEAMFVCYKSLLEKAYALQHSIEVYLGLLQHTFYPALTGIENLPVSLGCTTQNNTMSFQCPTGVYCKATDNSVPGIGSPPATKKHCLVSPHINGFTTSHDVHFKTNVLLDSLKKSEECIFNTEVPTMSPVDLTNAKSQMPTLIKQPDEVSGEGHKNGDCMRHVIRDVVGNLLNSNSQSRIQLDRPLFAYSQNSSPPPNHRTDIEQTNGESSLAVSATHNSFDRAYVSYNPRTAVHQKRKVYFKNKKLKKTFITLSHTTSHTGQSDSSPTKKSNFRGTSEEENEVSPEFKPLEYNGQIILSDAHPNVKLSKDIFYSLIVKSSGSATRLIRLLMKSFFTQDELAASSLSGEGIYKQRLEPSITEAIKIFIRKRHPQLKTGSINLCMTDVCVQARRVANNQRTRQHPTRLNSFPTNNNTGYATDNTNSELSNSPSVGLLGLKSRVSNGVRPISGAVSDKEPISLVHESKIHRNLNSSDSESWLQLGRTLDEHSRSFSKILQDPQGLDFGTTLVNSSVSPESNDLCISLHQSSGSQGGNSPPNYPNGH